MKDTIFLLKQKRTNSDVVFQQLFSESKEIFEQLDVEIRLPRIVPRQKHRENNQPGQTAEEYFRKSIYIPLLDSIIADLEERLSPEVLSLFNLGVFLPKTVYSEVDLVAVREAVKNYTELLHRPHISTVFPNQPIKPDDFTIDHTELIENIRSPTTPTLDTLDQTKSDFTEDLEETKFFPLTQNHLNETLPRAPIETQKRLMSDSSSYKPPDSPNALLPSTSAKKK
ncbi:hypothetical protein ACI65C_007174 [Semiaphis heraclei]